jgi:hypothetical protein
MDVVLPTIPEDFQPPSSSPDDVIDDDCDFDGDNDEGMMSLLRQNPADVAQRLIAMIEVESRPHYRSRDHLRGSHNEGCRSVVGTTVETRAKVVHWLYECVDYLGLNRELVESAMSNVDRLLSDRRRRRRRRRECEYGDVYDDVEDEDDLVDKALRDGSSYQLVALSSLFLVAKVAGSSSASPERRRRRGGGRKGGVDNGVVDDVRDYAALSHGAHSAAEIVSAERTILEGLGWRMSRPTSASIARHAVALFLDAAGTTTSRRNGAPSSSRSSGTSDLLRSIGERIEESVSDYGVSVSSSPSAIAFASVGCSLGSPSAVAAFGRAMARHGIVVAVAASASSSTGHRDGGDSMHRGGGRDPEEEGGVREGTSSFHSSTDALCESPKTRGVEESSEEANAMEEEKERSNGEGSDDRHRGRRLPRRRRRSRGSSASSTVSSDGSPTGVDEMITVDPRRGGRREQRTSSSDARRHDTTPRRSCGVAKMTMKSSTRIEICCGGVTDDRNNGKRSTDTRGRRVPLEP